MDYQEKEMKIRFYFHFLSSFTILRMIWVLIIKANQLLLESEQNDANPI